VTLAAAGSDAEAQGSATVGAAVTPCPLKSAYLEIALVNGDGSPVSDAAYKVTDADGQGGARLEGLPSGFCQVWIDVPEGDADAPAAGAPGRHFSATRKQLPCTTNERHVFHASDWGVADLDVGAGGAAPAEEPASAPAAAAAPEADDDDWDLADPAAS
jgi:hypothetical protein